MKDSISYTKVLHWLLLEEWRMHTTIFSKHRFVLFPFLILLFGGAIGAIVPTSTATVLQLLVAIHIIILLWGIQTASMGVDAKDALENVLGKTSPLVFTSRTLPISTEKLGFVFIVKDSIYYTFLFLLPLILGGTVGVLLSPYGGMITVSSLIYLPLVILTILLTFSCGASLGVVFGTLDFSTIRGFIVGFIFSLLLSIISITLYIQLGRLESVVEQVSVVLVSLLLITVISAFVGVKTFRRPRVMSSQERFTNKYERLSDFSTQMTNEQSIMVRTILDIHRSGGGLWKILFSSLILTTINVALLAFVSFYFGHPILYAPALGALTSVIAYPVYSIIFRYDSIEEYLRLPLTEQEVYSGKQKAYLLLTFTSATTVYIGVLAPLKISLISAAIGLVILYSLLVYQLSILTEIVGSRPSEFLFDGVAFTKYSVSSMMVLMPILILNLFGAAIPFEFVLASMGLSVMAAIFGMYILYIKN